LNLLNPPGSIADCETFFEKNKRFLKSLVIDNCPQLSKISSHYIIQIEQLSLTNCPQLNSLFLSNVGLEEITIKECPNLDLLDLTGNKLTHLDLSRLPELK
jgi:Leucine-rich repeat (LRR) protein